MTEFTVDPEKLDDVADALDKQVKRIRSEQERLRETIGTLSSRWRGEAQEKFVEMHSAWDSRLGDNVDALTQRAALAREAATTYREVDAAVADLFRT